MSCNLHHVEYAHRIRSLLEYEEEDIYLIPKHDNHGSSNFKNISSNRENTKVNNAGHP